MDRQELIAELKRQLELLESTGSYEVVCFKVWDSYDLEALGPAVVRVERNTWSWGSCRSETCRHNSHDPYMEGDSVWIACQLVAVEEEGVQKTYITAEGNAFTYRYAKENGYHFAPTARIQIEGAR